jgi:hypothetical protein
MDETTTRRNRTAFEALTLCPRRYPQVGSRPGEHALRMASGEEGPLGHKHRHA